MSKVLENSLKFFGSMLLLTPLLVAIIFVFKIWCSLSKWIWSLW